MTKLSLSILLILGSLIPLSGTCQVSTDTICYTVKELQKIAETLVKGQECDTLLKVAALQLANRDSVIGIQDQKIKNLESESSVKQSLLSVKEQKIQTLNLQLDQTKNKLVWTQVKWGFTTAALIAALGYSLLH